MVENARGRQGYIHQSCIAFVKMRFRKGGVCSACVCHYVLKCCGNVAFNICELMAWDMAPVIVQVVKSIWAYIKENNLQDPKNKKKIIVDEKLGKFLKHPVDMFSMNKQLSKHIGGMRDIS